MKKLRDIMRYGFLFTVKRQSTVAEAAHLMAKNNVGIVSVLDGDKLIGVFSERDVVQRVISRGLDPARTSVEDAMTTDSSSPISTRITNRRSTRWTWPTSATCQS